MYALWSYLELSHLFGLKNCLHVASFAREAPALEPHYSPPVIRESAHSAKPTDIEPEKKEAFTYYSSL